MATVSSSSRDYEAGVPEMRTHEKIITSRSYAVIASIGFVAGLILMCIPASPAVAHAMGTVVPRAVGGSVMGLSLAALCLRMRTDHAIRMRTSLLNEFADGDQGMPVTKEEWDAAQQKWQREVQQSLRCLDEDGSKS